MDHVSAEHLAGQALGLADEFTPAEASHLASCAACRSELDALLGTATTVRRGSDYSPLMPSPGVWERIAAEVSSDPVDSTRPHRGHPAG